MEAISEPAFWIFGDITTGNMQGAFFMHNNDMGTLLPGKFGDASVATYEIGGRALIGVDNSAHCGLHHQFWLVVAQVFGQKNNAVYMIGHDHKSIYIQSWETVGKRVPYRLYDAASGTQT